MTRSAPLAEIQKAFQAAVRGAGLSDALVHAICEKPPLSISDRLRIYQEAYLTRLTESLRDDFEQSRQRMGTAKFDQALQAFIEQHPSKSRNLAEYSEAFPSFLGQGDPELLELATREWMNILSWEAAEPEAALSAEDIQNGRPFRVVLHPSACLKFVGSLALLSHRSGKSVDIRELETWQARLIERLSQGATLDEIGRMELDEAGVIAIQEWMQAEILYCEAQE